MVDQGFTTAVNIL